MPDRYARQRILPELGDDAQRRLADAHAVVVGVGALGCAAADLLARAGLGSLTLVDRDLVETSNLHRQTLYTERDALDALPKAVAAERRLRDANPTVRLRALVHDVTPASAHTLLAERPAVLLDCTDAFETRYLLNDLAVRERLPLCYAGVVGTRLVVAAFTPGRACLRCVFGDPPPPGSQPTCETAGVLGPAAAIAGAYQAIDALRLLAAPDQPHPPIRSLDPWRSTHTTIAHPAPDDACPACAHARFEFLDAPHDPHAVLCGQSSVQVHPARPTTLDLAALAARLAPIGDVRATPFLLRASIDGVEFTVFEDARAIIRGTRDPARARAVYARYVGA